MVGAEKHLQVVKRGFVDLTVTFVDPEAKSAAIHQGEGEGEEERFEAIGTG
jgi:hypothetical protein